MLREEDPGIFPPGLSQFPHLGKYRFQAFVGRFSSGEVRVLMFSSLFLLKHEVGREMILERIKLHNFNWRF